MFQNRILSSYKIYTLRKIFPVRSTNTRVQIVSHCHSKIRIDVICSLVVQVWNVKAKQLFPHSVALVLGGSTSQPLRLSESIVAPDCERPTSSSAQRGLPDLQNPNKFISAYLSVSAPRTVFSLITVAEQRHLLVYISEFLVGVCHAQRTMCRSGVAHCSTTYVRQHTHLCTIMRAWCLHVCYIRGTPFLAHCIPFILTYTVEYVSGCVPQVHIHRKQSNTLVFVGRSTDNVLWGVGCLRRKLLTIF